MDLPDSTKLQNQSLWIRVVSFIGRVLLAISIPLIAFFVLYQGFLFLRDSDAPRAIIASGRIAPSAHTGRSARC